jgi:hypothetical protein
MKNSKVIKDINMANYLLDNNCKLFKIARDREDSTRLIFLFVHDEHLKKCMSVYK